MIAALITLAACHTPKSTTSFDDDRFHTWLNEDVGWIVTPEERARAAQLHTDADREAFRKQFWLSRDPTPDTPENEFQQGYQERYAYANSHYPSPAGSAGWKTDRGRAWIIYGKPDRIDSNLKGSATELPNEAWFYDLPDRPLTIYFVDLSGTGDLRMTLNPKHKLRKP